MNPQTLGSIQSVNLDAILRHTFVPDYSVRAVTEVFYVRIKRSLYLAAKRATLLERSQKDSSNQDQFDDEVEKVTLKNYFITCLFFCAILFEKYNIVKKINILINYSFS